jgi:hypothetical protein
MEVLRTEAFLDRGTTGAFDFVSNGGWNVRQMGKGVASPPVAGKKDALSGREAAFVL